MSVTTYLGTSSHIWYWSLHVLERGIHLPFALIDNIEQWRVHSVLWQFWRGSICLWYLYIYIRTGISLYFLISWLFWMGSHWWHWTAKSSLWALAVLNGGVYCKFYPGKNWHFLIFSYSWLFWMGSHWWHWKAKSLLCALAVLNGGSIISFTWVNLKIWAHLQFYALLHRRSFCITYGRPNQIVISWVKCLS